MYAMVLRAARTPLVPEPGAPVPSPGSHEVLLRVRACGVCRTDLHIVDGELERPHLPLILGHQIVGEVLALGAGASEFRVGERVGVPWLGGTDGDCGYCRTGRENLCDHARFTGYDRDGGYAEQVVADERFCVRLPSQFGDVEAAPLLCAGLIGFRSLRLAGDAHRVGLYGFGSSAHIIAQVAHDRGQEVYAFTRPGDAKGQAFARSLGADWAGGSDESPPRPLDAALIFAPVGPLVPAALAATAKGGTVVCAGIHMSDLPSFPYRLLWEERSVRSVANLTRDDAREFFPLAARIPVRAVTTTFPLGSANEAIAQVRAGKIEGSAVLVP
jgi:alcohol dehydrogenase, propanol-preferring